jgi:transcriptional regulator with XRE-family HTH domain
MSFPHIIRALRERGYTQTDIAKAVGVDQGTISRIAAGKTSVRYDIGAALIRLADRAFARDAEQTQKAQTQAQESST